MCRPETESDAAAELVAMLHEYARKLHLAGIAGSVVRRRFAGPAVLMPADENEIILLR